MKHFLGIVLFLFSTSNANAQFVDIHKTLIDSSDPPVALENSNLSLKVDDIALSKNDLEIRFYSRGGREISVIVIYYQNGKLSGYMNTQRITLVRNLNKPTKEFDVKKYQLKLIDLDSVVIALSVHNIFSLPSESVFGKGYIMYSTIQYKANNRIRQYAFQGMYSPDLTTHEEKLIFEEYASIAKIFYEIKYKIEGQIPTVIKKDGTVDPNQKLIDSLFGGKSGSVKSDN